MLCFSLSFIHALSWRKNNEISSLTLISRTCANTGTYDAQGQFGGIAGPETMQSPAAAGKYFHLASGGVAPSCDLSSLVVDLHLQRHIKAVVTARSLRSIELYCLLIEQFALARETRSSGARKSAQGCILPHVKVIRWPQLNRQLIESLCHKAALFPSDLPFGLRVGNPC